MKSLLFVPATAKMLSKIETLNADAYIIDLEDSILQENKQNALLVTINYLQANSDKLEKIYIRLDKTLLKIQIEALKPFNHKGYMLPKFELNDEYINYIDYLKNKDIIALIETPLGIIKIEDIAALNWINALAFGAEDFTAKLSMQNTSTNLIYAKSKIITAGKAYNKKVYDTPSFTLDDLDELHNEIKLSVDSGFNGKLAINPKQIPIINSCFTAFDINNIKAIIKKYEDSNMAVLKIDNKIYEKMHIEHLKRILKEISN